LAFGLTACSDSDGGNDKVENTYQISLTNNSANQPFSPVAVILHETGYTGWTLSELASEPLELLAEGGMNSEFISLASEHEGYLTSGSSTGALEPGHTLNHTISLDPTDNVELTLATMLVNTNDAFTGVTGLDLSELSVGDQLTYTLPIYDAGTEFNSELEGTIPGPADGGDEKGFDTERDDIADQVTMHPGVVGHVEGSGLDEHPSSVLNNTHKFDAPIARLIVTRTQ
jgi:hypothetical protein